MPASRLIGWQKGIEMTFITATLVIFAALAIPFCMLHLLDKLFENIKQSQKIEVLLDKIMNLIKWFEEKE
jgi:hypothetical protein